ncbi:NUDIX hydrolase [Halomonas pacifica]|uniref:NUDIX hydrolase n=1 Tax=Bisbaumannia pacifica TaxID=77098 RepID=UPI0023593805|nr:NUDIX hydrolase [Halomonas pacifica]MDC8802641.1 NUDIX hydrolase [Halomonas pacifica]
MMSGQGGCEFVETSKKRPVVATIAVLLKGDKVLLVRRSNPPDAGRWGFPGGKIERGETIEEAALRELYEETNVTANMHRVFNAVDVLDFDKDGGLEYHFVLVAVLCVWVSGEPLAGDDALEACFFNLDDVNENNLAMSLDVEKVARQAMEVYKNELVE